jgi:Cu(I)/Ag(I) efflux system periplasmic protein CusF
MMKHHIAIVCLTAAACAYAADNAQMAPASPAAPATAQKMSEANTAAEVRKIDKAAGKLTLKHEAIENLQMPPMTMVFRVRDPSLLDALKAGDKVKVRVEQIEGNYTVTAIETGQ